MQAGCRSIVITKILTSARHLSHRNIFKVVCESCYLSVPKQDALMPPLHVRPSICLVTPQSRLRLPSLYIPLPCIGVFGRMPSGLPSSQRAKLHFRRALCLVVLALNFWWSGGVFIEEKLLRRTPSFQQNIIIRRIVSFMQTDGPRVPFAIATVGRRIPKLVARISELSDLLTSVGSGSSPYDKMFPGFEDADPMDNGVAEELEPYRSLDSKRLKIVGTGHWDPTDLMSDALVMAFFVIQIPCFSTDSLAQISPRSQTLCPKCWPLRSSGIVLDF